LKGRRLPKKSFIETREQGREFREFYLYKQF